VEVGGDVRRARLGRLSDGGVWATLEPLADGTCIADVSIVPPAGDRVVLRGALGVCPARPAA
jgi:hypothetical protein